jgi:hypothetical protein
MPNFGPTEGQKRVLRNLGEDPAAFQEHLRVDITQFLRGRLSSRRSPANPSNTFRAKRIEDIRKKKLAPDMVVVRKGKSMTKDIGKTRIDSITEDGYIILEGGAKFSPFGIHPVHGEGRHVSTAPE